MSSSHIPDGDCLFCCITTKEKETEIILTVRRLSGFVAKRV
jgi:hypothetical protein